MISNLDLKYVCCASIFSPAKRDCVFLGVMMMERKLYKTKLCILYQRGRCSRQSCSFAHGEAELRRFEGSFSGKHDYRSDLRDKLQRRYSPHRRYSPGRDTRRPYTFHGNSLSRSPGRRSERRGRKKHYIDGQSDASGSHQVSDGAEEGIKEANISSNYDKDAHQDQLKQVKMDLQMLEDHKCQLEIALQEKLQEAESLTSTIEELALQLNKEHEECGRMTSKLKKFIKAHNRYLRSQEDLKRTQARLQRLGDQLGSDSMVSVAHEEDSSVNIVSDGDPYRSSPMNKMYINASPVNKRLRITQAVTEGKPE